MQIDGKDINVLRLLQLDGKLSNAKIAEITNQSEAPSWRRIKKLEENGVIKRYEARLDRRKLGFGLLAFVQLEVSIHTEEATKIFEEAILARPEVLQFYNVTGEADFLLCVVAKDIDAYGEFIDKWLRKITFIKNIRSSIVLREIRCTLSLPI